MSKHYNLGVFIGRFQPLHFGHFSVIQEAIKQVDCLLILIGSINRSKNAKNPFNFCEREKMILETLENSLSSTELTKIKIKGVEDYYYNEGRWEAEVEKIVFTTLAEIYHLDFQVEELDKSLKKLNKIDICIFGYKKDSSSYYLESFYSWDFIPSPVYNYQDKVVDATFIRHCLFSDPPKWETIEKLIPSDIYKFLNHYATTEEYQLIRDEYNTIETYKERWLDAPYPPTFNTVHALVVHNHKILLIERWQQPGKGSYALPGGFIHADERIRDAVLRQLREETRLKIPLPVLKGSLQRYDYFDHPQRSLRGRTVTYAFFFKIDVDPYQSGDPKVKGNSDTIKNFWLPVTLLDTIKDRFFEDHYDIIHYFLAST